MKYVRGITIGLFVCVCVIFAVSRVIASKRDTTAPVIVSSEEEIHAEAGCDEAELLTGLRASDDRDGDLTDQIMVRKISRFLEKGVCNIEYVVFDKSNNAGTFERKVYFDHYKSPEFRLSQPLLYGVNSTITISDRLSAEDVMSGDLSDRVKIVSGNINRSDEGTYQITVEVTNEYGDTSRSELPVNVVSQGKLSCTVELETYLLYVKAGEIINPSQYITKAEDRSGEEIDRENIIITQQVDLRVPGSGQYIYEVFDGTECTGMSCLTVIVTE